MYWAVHITMLTFGTATMGGKLTFVYSVQQLQFFYFLANFLTKQNTNQAKCFGCPHINQWF